MSNTWFWSDQHAGHANIISFMRADGVTRLRPEFFREARMSDMADFRDVEAMNQTMIDNYNKTVKPGDKVYFGGDVAFKLEDFNGFMSRLTPCKRYLILGNHDKLDAGVYGAAFRRVLCWEMFDGFILSHVPVHPSQMGDRGGRKVNVHGHLHSNVILREGSTQPDPRYINICVEHTNYGLVHIDELAAQIKQRGL